MSKIKLFGVGVRRADISPEEFHDHWRHPHGTWGRQMTTLRGYVQSHQIHTELLGPEQSRRELVAEMWLDNEKDVRGFREEPVLVKYLLADEPTFVDVKKAIFFATEEEVIASGPSPGPHLGPGDDMWSPWNRPISIKLLHFVGTDGVRGWARPQDEELGRKLGALRHVRCHPLASFHGTNPPFLGVHELWWPTVSAFRAGARRAPDALAALLADAGTAVTLLVQAERLL